MTEKSDLLQIEDKLDDILQHFDNQTEPFNKRDVLKALRELRHEWVEIEDVPMPLKADYLAFDLPTVDHNGQDIKCEGLPNIIDEKALQHWEMRANTFKNPVLRLTYAEVLWLHSRIINKRAYPDMAKLAIGMMLKILHSKNYIHGINARKCSERALDLALKFGDKARITNAIEVMITVEDAIAIDDKPGLWGFSFDNLFENTNIELTEAQKAKLLQDLEARLKRLVEPATFHLLGAQQAAMRLINHFNKQKNRPEAQRIVRIFAKGIMHSIEIEKSPQISQTNLFDLFVLYLKNGLKKEAGKLEAHLYESGEKGLDEMQAFTTTIDLGELKVKEFASQMVRPELDDSLFAIAVHCLTPSREVILEEVKEAASYAPMYHLFGKKHIDQHGRIIAQTGGIDEQIEPPILERLMWHIQFDSFYLRAAIEEVFRVHSVNVDKLLDFLYASPVFKDSKKAFFRDAIQAYLDDRHSIMAHLLIPQIEDAIRHLARLEEVSTLQWDSANNGLDYRTLGQILSDDDFKVIFGALGERIVFYLRAILTQELGWNLRNELCHGLVLPENLDSVKSDRLFHILLLLAVYGRPFKESQTSD